MSATPHSPTRTREMSRREKLRFVRSASRRRVRGREDLAPVAIQQIARRVDDAAHLGVDRVRRLLAGDRPFLLGLAVIVLLAVVVMSGPMQQWMDQRARVDLAEQELAVLQEANATLEQRAADLTDPEHVEVLAREQLGYARPGEVAYSLVPPSSEEGAGQIADTLVVQVEQPSWWQRLADALLGR